MALTDVDQGFLKNRRILNRTWGSVGPLLIAGIVIFYGVLIILLNFLVDLIYAWLNPKVRYDEKR